jgi:NAD(P)H-hydrate epimerase
MEIVSRSCIRNLFPKRKKWSHKGDFGKLLIIGGGNKYSGSPALAALAAYRTGVDLVTVAAPGRAANIIASFSPDIITHPLKGDFLNPDHVRELLDMEKHTDAVVIGGGLGRNKETDNAVLGFLKKSNIPCVIDADAIHVLADDADIIKKKWILTPHSIEFKSLTREEPEPNVEDRSRLVKYFSSKFNTTILLKGSIDVISDGNALFANSTGNPYMTKGGTGDVLAGICGALLATGASPLDAACAAAYINGIAGNMTAKKYGPGMLASDMISFISEVIK